MSLQSLELLIHKWVMLNRHLCEPFALQPDNSIFLNDAYELASAISHLPERYSKKRYRRGECFFAGMIDCSIFNDIADTYKHPADISADRKVEMKTAALLELDKAKTKSRFLRNIIRLSHPSFGCYDFMQIAYDGLREFSMNLAGIQFIDILLAEKDDPFVAEVVLIHDRYLSPGSKSVDLNFVERTQDNQLILSDPVSFAFRIEELLPS